jgi:hypothetical protein
MNKRQTIEWIYNHIGTLLHEIKQGVTLPALKEDLEDLLAKFPDDLTIVDELAALKRKPPEQWAVVLLAALDQLLVQAPPTSTMRINGDVIDYLQARRDGDWQKIREIRDSFVSVKH